MTRAVYRFRQVCIEPDLRPEAEPFTFLMRCAACGAASAQAETSDAAAGWIPSHLREEPGHLEYREHITRPYRAVPGAWL